MSVIISQLECYQEVGGEKVSPSTTINLALLSLGILGYDPSLVWGSCAFYFINIKCSNYTNTPSSYFKDSSGVFCLLSPCPCLWGIYTTAWALSQLLENFA